MLDKETQVSYYYENDTCVSFTHIESRELR